AEGSPAAAIEDEQVLPATLRGQVEDAAVRRGQAELGKALADARPILAGAVHRIAEEEPDEEREERRAHDRGDHAADAASVQGDRKGGRHAEGGEGQKLPGDAPEATQQRVAPHVEAEAREDEQRPDEDGHGKLSYSTRRTETRILPWFRSGRWSTAKRSAYQV